ncbi:Uncharacterised protein [Sebaldella termitidis]|uniref:Uncharacterized protein n=1 Tax=Sebaldella termitidis (strain ATCC 33386 / NCTC 11300) TaxID=526218 RepID=D1AQP0_SEBTE|nr:hypothetical protein [Sebaldella termitidis]ACZ10300.1 hypothetical protein Sterm_3461 [Sebaldella termitidis ATCC 33386]SUI25639.1 Uncharacterised protein [Sebaldella termitidis]
MYKSERRKREFEKSMNSKKYKNHSNTDYKNHTNFEDSELSSDSLWKSLLIFIFYAAMFIVVYSVKILWTGVKYIKSVIIQKNQERIKKEKENQIRITEKEAAAKNSIWIDNNGNKIINSEKEIVTAEEKNDIWIEYTE